MKTFKTNIIKRCDQCGNLSIKDYSEMILFEKDKTIEQIKNRKIDIFTCPKCGRKIRVGRSFQIFSTDKKYVIDFRSLNDDMSNMSYYLKNLDHSFSLFAMSIKQKMGIDFDECNYRLVFTKASLLEKIDLFENGFDDRVIEILKYKHIQNSKEKIVNLLTKYQNGKLILGTYNLNSDSFKEIKEITKIDYIYELILFKMLPISSRKNDYIVNRQFARNVLTGYLNSEPVHLDLAREKFECSKINVDGVNYFFKTKISLPSKTICTLKVGDKKVSGETSNTLYLSKEAFSFLKNNDCEIESIFLEEEFINRCLKYFNILYLKYGSIIVPNLRKIEKHFIKGDILKCNKNVFISKYDEDCYKGYLKFKIISSKPYQTKNTSEYLLKEPYFLVLNKRKVNEWYEITLLELPSFMWEFFPYFKDYKISNDCSSYLEKTSKKSINHSLKYLECAEEKLSLFDSNGNLNKQKSNIFIKK